MACPKPRALRHWLGYRLGKARVPRTTQAVNAFGFHVGALLIQLVSACMGVIGSLLFAIGVTREFVGSGKTYQTLLKNAHRKMEILIAWYGETKSQESELIT
jgi:hypothetical protein